MHPADGPGDTGVAVAVAAVERVAVVLTDGDAQRRGRIRRPLEDLLGPVHAHVAVHLAGAHHLLLGRVPQRILGGGRLEHLLVVQVRPRVAGVLGQGLPGPGGETGHLVVGLGVQHEVVGQFAAHHQLLGEGLRLFAAKAAFAQAQQHPLGADHAEMEIGREIRRDCGVRVVALAVGHEPLAQEPIQGSPGRRFAGLEPVHRADPGIDPQGGAQRGKIGRVHRLRPGMRVGRQGREGGAEPFEQPVDLRPQGTRRKLAVVRGNAAGHDVARVHLVHRREPCRDQGAQPLPLDAQGIEVGDHQPGADRGADPNDLHLRVAALDQQRDVFRTQGREGGLQPAEEKIVRPQRRVEKVGPQAEDHGHGHTPAQGLLAGLDQGPVVPGPELTVHPVEHRTRGVEVLVGDMQAATVHAILRWGGVPLCTRPIRRPEAGPPEMSTTDDKASRPHLPAPIAGRSNASPALILCIRPERL